MGIVLVFLVLMLQKAPNWDSLIVVLNTGDRDTSSRSSGRLWLKCEVQSTGIGTQAQRGTGATGLVCSQAHVVRSQAHVVSSHAHDGAPLLGTQTFDYKLELRLARVF